MKHIIWMLLLIWGLGACSDDDNVETVTVKDLPENAFSFKPITGGAVMSYALPPDVTIVGVNVRYRNAFGVECIRQGGWPCDTVTLIGFKEAQSEVPAQVTLSYYNGAESQPFDETFSTLDSGPVVFLESVECRPTKDGFSLSYQVPEGANGIVHVFYVGTNPLTDLPDNILLKSFYLEETENGKGFDEYEVKQDLDILTVVVKVEDFLGYTVGEKVWEDVESMPM